MTESKRDTDALRAAEIRGVKAGLEAAIQVVNDAMGVLPITDMPPLCVSDTIRAIRIIDPATVAVAKEVGR